MGKTQQLQIRVTGAEKAALKRLAQSAGLGVSAYVLSRALPRAKIRFAELLRSLHEESEPRYVLAELSDLLVGLTRPEFLDAVSEASVGALSPYWQNYVAAMVEQAAHQKGVSPPAWLGEIEPLAEPHFVAPLASLRPHLLRTASVPFRRRNIFADSGLGDRI
jgi:uncharacterized protein (DUF1778 family)